MRNHLATIITCLLITAAGLIVYFQLGNYDYILYDDRLSIYGPVAGSGHSMKERVSAFFEMTDRLPYQVPVPALVRMILLVLFGDDLGKHHLFSVFLHLSCALLLFLFLRSATGKTPESGLCALLFTVHPLNVEPVSWLAGYNGMLEAFFLMTALTCYYYYVKRPSWKRYLLVFPPFILGLMCKPTMMILPFLLFLIDYWPLRRFELTRAGLTDLVSGFRRNKILAEKIPLIALVPLQWMMERLITADKLREAGPGLPGFHPGAMVDFAAHLKRIIYPTGLAIARPAPPETSLWPALAVMGTLLLVSVVILLKARSHRYIMTGWFWTMIALAPVLLMIFLSGRPIEDRHLYIPLIGIFIIFSFGLSSVMSGLKHGRYYFPAAGILVIALLTPAAHLQARHWENSITMFSHAIAIYPDNKKAHVNLGDAYMEIDKTGKAIHHYRQFLRISPDSALGYTKLAAALAVADRREEAIRYYEKAMTLDPGYAPAVLGLADMMTQEGKTDRAIILYRKALQIYPDMIQAHNNLALTLFEQGDAQGALFHLEQAIRINPHYHTAIMNRRLILEDLSNRR